MKICTLIGFNNYYNRIFKKRDTLSAYENDSEAYAIFDDINFDPKDQILTSQVINHDYEADPGDPDYLIVMDEYENIVSRWFVMEMVRTRKGQYRLDLRRDVLAEHIDTILEAPIFIQRAMLRPDDPLIFNDEGMVFNRIKVKETMIRDESGQGWIVGYMDGETAQTITIANAVPTDYLTIEQAASITGLDSQIIEDLLSGSSVVGTNNWVIRFNFVNSLSLTGTISQGGIRFSGNVNEILGTARSIFNLANHNTLITSLNPGSLFSVGNTFVNNQSRAITRFKALTSSDCITDDVRRLENLAKPIQYDGKLWDIVGLSITQAPQNRVAQLNDPAINNIISSGGFPVASNGQFELTSQQSQISLVKELNQSLNLTVSLGGDTKPVLKNRPYRMFCIPTGKYRWRAIKPTEEDPNPRYTDYDASDIAFKVAAEIQRQASDSAKLGIYDLQYLPYCPIRRYIHPNIFAVDRYNFVIAGYAMDANLIAEVKRADGDHAVMMHIFYCEEDSFTYTNDKVTIPVSNPKIESNCNLYRLCSPNYQGAFDFNAAKNNGVSGFVVKCTYKPYTPYIRVAPIFAGLYGAEFNDQRGLICGGNFSMSQSSSAWAQYELNNKNYQNIFNREIQSMDFAHGQQTLEAQFGAATGTIQQGIAGAQTGAMVGGPWGAAIGAVVGTATGAIGGAMDLTLLAGRQKDQRDLAVQKYNYQLGNIRALPNTLTKIDAFDISSKIFPFLETYTCTDQERQALEDKIRYESMIVMRIGKMSDYIAEGSPSYIKANLIRDENLFDDYHIFNEVNIELEKGVYI